MSSLGRIIPPSNQLQISDPCFCFCAGYEYHAGLPEGSANVPVADSSFSVGFKNLPSK